MNWNVLRGEASDSDYGTVLSAIADYEVNGLAVVPDVVTLQETNSGTSSFFASALEALNPGSDYVWSNAGSSLPVGIVYNASAYDLVGSATVIGDPRPARRFDLRPKGYASEDAVFSVYSFHLKAGGDGPSGNQLSDEDRRAIAAAGFRANADGLRPGADQLNVLYTGDFNIRNSSEGGFSNFTSAGGRAEADDPVRRYGTYKNNSAFRDVHTHSSGEIDDRFDLQLVSLDALDGEGFAYIGPRGEGNSGLEHSYTIVGNSGNLYNRSVTQSTDPQLSTAEKQALRNASDHLPLFADYQLPAWMRVTPLAEEPLVAVIQGSGAGLEYRVENVAPVSGPNGADELDFVFSGTGAAIGTGGGEVSAGSSEMVAIGLDTREVGLFDAGVGITGTSQAVQDGTFTDDVSVLVVAGANATFGDPEADALFYELDFGRLILGETPAAGGVTVFNERVGSAQASLDITDVTLAGSEAFGFDASSLGSVLVDGSLELLFDFEATGLGRSSAFVTIETADGSEFLGAQARQTLNVVLRASVAGSLGDLDLDGDVDVVDLDLFGRSLLSEGDDALGDLDLDGDVDVTDLDLFANDLLRSEGVSAETLSALASWGVVVPEPGVGVLVVCGAFVLLGRTRKAAPEPARPRKR
ncbi:MAG: hypothetical protein AAFX76_10840 [Planctomycetota bacterium]